MTTTRCQEDHMADMIDDILKADEEALKAKRSRLQNLAKKLAAARQSIEEVQSAVEDVLTHDGLSRAEVATTFELTAQEKRALMPARKPAAKSETETTPEQSFTGAAAAY
ncbi:hypothetical protein DN479_31330 [Burkholderia multivorans]|nr:hypothetical protein DN479_31330 [Burkholderia multivorans]RAD76077.1 hypothetical protein DN508_32955 [Burkholderia multivorans]RAE58067.1 hypothetical protein DN473_31125 [Burkholderia multivorans]RAE75769.1 hypothetical protein DN540_31430 [Burkholderia multivorans]RAF25875.1 hypothetical protein DN545_30995 [Burkholderia multivorans]